MSKARGPYRVDPLGYKKANEALDKMAENARELGLDYELQDKDPDLIEQPAQQEPWPENPAAPVQQEACPTCGEYEPRTGTCGTSPNDKRALCNRNPPQPAQQEPVALKPCWYESKQEKMCRKCGQVHAEAIPPAQQPAQTDWEAVAADQAMTIALLRAEQPAQQQEPVAWIVEDQSGERLEWAGDAHSCHGVPTFPLYTSPPAQRTWVELTDEEIESIFNNWPTYHLDHEEFARAIEAKLKQRNT